MNRLFKLSLVGALLLTTDALVGQTTLTANEAVSLAANVAPAATDEVQEFTVNLTRRAKVGQKMRVECEGLQEQTVTAIGHGSEQTLEKNVFNVELIGEAHVLSVNRTGAPTRVAYTVTSCTMTHDGTATEIAAPGSTITALLKNDATVFEVNGRSVGADAQAALEVVASLSPDATTENRLVGSDRPRVVGESWALDRTEAVKEFQKHTDRPISASDVFGITTLVDVTDHAGQKCLVLHSRISTENVIPGLSLPSGMELKKASMNATYQSMYPIDQKYPSLSDSMRTDTVAILYGTVNPGQPPMEVRVNGVRVVEIATTPLATWTASAEDSDASLDD